MACWTVDTVSVEFQAKYKDLIEAAIRSLGFQYYVDEDTIFIEDRIAIDLTTQTAKVADNDFTALNQLKQAYSRTVIETVSKKKRWSIQAVGQNKLRARRY